MKKQILFYIYQFGVIVLIFISLLFIFRLLFNLQSDWAEGAIAGVTALITIIIEIGRNNLKKKKRRDQLRAQNPQDSKNNNFGIDGFSFYDHDDRGYVPSLITLQISKEYTYDLNQSFSENALRIAKFQAVADFVGTKSELKDIILEELVHEIITTDLQGSFDDKDEVTLLVDSITKSRMDVSQDRKEASTLNIQLAKSNLFTKMLIDKLFERLKKICPRTLTASYKTDEKYNLDDNFIDDLMCFVTSINIYGGVISDPNIKGVNDKKIYYLWFNKPPYGFRLPIELPTFDGQIKIHGDQLSVLTLDFIKGHIKIKNKISRYPTFTDISLSFSQGLTASLLCAVLISDTVESNNAFCAFQNTVDYAHNFASKIPENDYAQLFYFSYLLSVVRKIDNHRLSSVTI